MDEVAAAVDQIARDTSFSGVVRVDVEDQTVCAAAFGMADRAHGVANTMDIRFGVASGAKGFTAMTVMSLIQDGVFALGTPARSLLGRDLALVGDDVTIEHLLAHRSGIGDYLDEDIEHDITDYIMTRPAHELATTEAFLPMLDGLAAKAPPGETFCYNNSGYVLLALLCERATGVSYHELVHQRVCAPAGLQHTEFLRSDELPGDAAVGYLAADGLRTNVFHLPIRGNGDGGIYTTADDVHRLWHAFFAGAIVSPHLVTEMIRPRSDVRSDGRRYGLGFWLHLTGDPVMLVGHDPGVSFRTLHDPARRLTHTVIANTARGAWPVSRRLDEILGV